MASPKTYIRKPSTEQYSQAGFTLIEILVVIAIFAILAGFTGLMGIDSYRGYTFRSERDNIVSILQKVRGQAMSNTCAGGVCDGGEPHGVHFGSGEYILFQGASLNDTPENASHNLTIKASYDVNVNIAPSGTDAVIFSQLSGDVVAPVTISLTDDFGHSSDITINTEGRISWSN